MVTVMCSLASVSIGRSIISAQILEEIQAIVGISVGTVDKRTITLSLIQSELVLKAARARARYMTKSGVA